MVTWRELIGLASRAMSYSYAPYSGFRVGSALLTLDGDVILGSNIENASYGLSICAERVAVFKAVSSGRRRFSAIAIVSDGINPLYPCGACRQVLLEFSPDISVIVRSRRGYPLRRPLRGLLPLAFGPREMEKKGSSMSTRRLKGPYRRASSLVSRTRHRRSPG